MIDLSLTIHRTPIECFGDDCQNEGNQATSTNCHIPNYGPHTRYSILGELGNVYQMPGDEVQQYSNLEIICDRGYKPNLFSDLRTSCVNGQWSPLLTFTCLRTCPTLNSTTSTNVTCKYNDMALDNCHNPIEQATAHLLCNPFYEEDALHKNVIRTCAAGKWTPAISECRPICGVRSTNGKHEIIKNGQNDIWEGYPSSWLVGIYNDQNQLICSGSIIDRHIILTAAHCVASIYGLARSEETFLIAAGKYYRAYIDDRAKLAQYSKVLQIYVPEGYKGINSSVDQDIAIITLTDPFTLSEAVLPVCVELNQESPYLNSSLNLSGFITGWGSIEETATLSKVRKELDVSIIPFDRCSDSAPNAGICVEFSSYEGVQFCDGDTGGGLVFKNTSSERYYIEGISSKAPVLPRGAPECEGNQFFHISTLPFSSVKDHVDFIKNVLVQNQIPQSIEFLEEEPTK